MSSAAFVLSAEADVERVDPGITRQILGFGDGIMTCRVTFEAGAVGYVHSHPHSQTSYVESGLFRFEVDGISRDVRAGDCVYIAPELSHGAICIEAGVLIDNFSPLRADFLGGAE